MLTLLARLDAFKPVHCLIDLFFLKGFFLCILVLNNKLWPQSWRYFATTQHKMRSKGKKVFEMLWSLVTCCDLRGSRDQPVVGQKQMNAFIARTEQTLCCVSREGEETSTGIFKMETDLKISCAARTVIHCSVEGNYFKWVVWQAMVSKVVLTTDKNSYQDII